MGRYFIGFGQRNNLERISNNLDVFQNFVLTDHFSNVYGDYVLECMFPPSISKHLALLFSKISSAKEYDAVLLEDIFTMKAKFSIKLWKNKTLARQLEQKIRQFF